ncbi:MAG: tetratricopeptide repeat protein, partial [Silvibacterium sp.]
MICGAQALPAHPAAKPPQVKLSDVEDLVRSGQLDAAQQQLDILAAKHPEPAGVERLRGYVSYQQNRLADADAAFARALAQDPNDRESAQMRGVVLYRIGQPAQAIPFLERAHMAIPGANIDPDYVLASAYLAAGRYDDARHAFAAQYGFPPDSAQAWLLAARMLLRHELVPAAEDSARKALAIDPHLPLAHQLLGEIALARQDPAAAIAELEIERQLNPLNPAVYDRLGDAYLRSEDLPDARRALDRAVLLEPNASGPYILLGKALLAAQQPITAAMYLERAVAIDPGNFTAHMLLGQA